MSGHFLAPDQATPLQVLPRDLTTAIARDPNSVHFRSEQKTFKNAFITRDANGLDNIQDVDTYTVLKIGPLSDDFALTSEDLTSLRKAAENGTDVMGLHESHVRHLRAGPLLAMVKYGQSADADGNERTWYVTRKRGQIDLDPLLRGLSDSTAQPRKVDTEAQFWFCPNTATSRPVSQSDCGWIASWQPGPKDPRARMPVGAAMLQALNAGSSTCSTVTGSGGYLHRFRDRMYRARERHAASRTFSATTQVDVVDPRRGKIGSSRATGPQSGQLDLELTICPLDPDSTQDLQQFVLDEQSWERIMSCLRDKADVPLDAEQTCVISCPRSAYQSIGQYGQRTWTGITELSTPGTQGSQTSVPVSVELSVDCYDPAFRRSWPRAYSRL